MADQHPITPPPELVQHWASEFYGTIISPGEASIAIANQAAQWGADMELEACVEWMGDSPVIWRGDPEEHPGFYLREARRPKPPSLKEQALKALDDISIASFEQDAANIIRQALEALPE